MRSALTNLAAIQHDDVISAPNGGEAMGYQDGGAPFRELDEALEERSLGLGIKGGRWFIKNQDWRLIPSKSS